MSTAVGVDVGGTWVKLGLVRGGRILAEDCFLTRPYLSSPLALEGAMAAGVERLIRGHRGAIGGVGVGIPGLVDYPEGVVRRCANLKGWSGIALKAHLARRLRRRVEVDNDVHGMTLAECKYGAGRNVRNLICMTLGTGVGGGLLLDGRLVRGRGGPAGEIGHLWVEPDGVVCPCGGKGCLERYVGNQAILRAVRARLKKGERSVLRQMVAGRWDRLTPALIDRACERGDRLAMETWAEAGERIGRVLANLVNLLNPEKIVIGGGLAQAGKWLFGPIRQTVRKRSMRGLGRVSIVPAALGPSAGVVGAALLVEKRRE